MIGFFFLVGCLVVLSISLVLSSTWEIRYGLINLDGEGKNDKNPRVPLPHVRADSAGGTQNEGFADRVLLGAVNEQCAV